MAIQQINLGSAPSGAGGDTQRAANTKINENFSNPDHAASRLVGVVANQIPLAKDVYDASHRTHTKMGAGGTLNTNAYFNAVVDLSTDVAGAPKSLTSGRYVYVQGIGDISTYGGQVAWGLNAPDIFYRRRLYGDFTGWVKFYHTGNTTKDTATGFLKASSPVLHVYNDSITKIHEAEQLDITVDKKGVGHYEIHGTTGLRKNDGWFMSPPRDVHGNVLCMVDLEEEDGVVILRTYKKKFDFDIVAIVHDYDNPMDIPEGVCVEFRFNDLPQEQLDEPIE